MTITSFNVLGASSSLVTLLAADMAALHPATNPNTGTSQFGSHGDAGGSSGTRPLSGLHPTTLTPYGVPQDWDIAPHQFNAGGNVLFTQSLYDAVVADMKAIYRLSGGLNDAGIGMSVVNNQRMRGSAYFNSTYQTLWYDTAPPWITQFDIVKTGQSYTATWTVVNKTDTTNYDLRLYHQSNLGWGYHPSNPFDLNTSTGTSHDFGSGKTATDAVLVIYYITLTRDVMHMYSNGA